MKKNKLFSSVFSLAVLLVLLVTACTKQDKNEMNEVQESALSLFKTVDDIKALELDAKFNLSADIYDYFLNSAMFIDGQLRGFYYADVVKNMSDEEQVEFWAHFNVKIQPTADLSQEEAKAYSRDGVEPPRLSDGICLEYDAIPFACRPANGWVCMYLC